MGYTCENCNGIGILNYDSDLPRYKQEICPNCEGEGVLYEKIKEMLEEPFDITPDRIEKLKMPKITSPTQQGNVVRVIGMFKDEKGTIWINTASEDNKLVNMELSDELRDWGEHGLHMIKKGVIPFPCDIEFGEYCGRQYAEIL